MKLRNKKTGEIVDLIGTERSCPYITINVDFHDGNPIAFDYTSLAELNEEWEDYTPQEPLIKDEKIRKAVRAWAEANNFKDNIYFGKFDRYNECFFLNDTYDDKQIWFTKSLDNLDSKTYTITELCGDKEDE